MPAADSGLPLSGRRIVVTRTRAQASSLTAALAELGAEPVEIPLLRIDAPSDGGAALRSAASRIDEFAWCVLTSPNGAARLLAALDARDEVRRPTSPRAIAVVGPATARVLTDAGLSVDLIAQRHVGEGLVADFPVAEEPGRVLLAQAEVARSVVRDGITARGWTCDVVPAYRTVAATVSDADRAALDGADAITFASSSTVTAFCDALGARTVPPVVCSIGPITSATAIARGLHVDIEADPHTIAGMVDALVAHYAPRA